MIYDACYYIGVFLTGILIGKEIGSIKINYNFYILVGSIFTLIAYLTLKKIDLEKYNNKEKKSPKALNSVVNKMKQDKISRIYILYNLAGEISYNCISGLLVIILTDYFSFSELAISNYSIMVGIGAVFIGALMMEKFTFKNNYINLMLKYGIRLILYLCAFILNNKILILITLIFQKLSSDAYIHITDAPYVNRYNDEEQLAFNNLKEMIDYVAKSLGLFLCGIALNYGLRYIFLVGSIFAIIHIIFACYALYLRNKEGEINDRKRLG